MPPPVPHKTRHMLSHLLIILAGHHHRLQEVCVCVGGSNSDILKVESYFQIRLLKHLDKKTRLDKCQIDSWALVQFLQDGVRSLSLHYMIVYNRLPFGHEPLAKSYQSQHQDGGFL